VAFPAIEHRSRLEPPPGLAKREREVFIGLAAQAGHLKATDAALLASLAQAIVLSRRLARDPAKVSEWEKAVRAQAMLSTKLRMTPQSRTDSRAAGRHQQEPTGADPW
jgi:hypothetical protein